MNRFAATVGSVLVMGIAIGGAQAERTDDAAAESLGWRLGVQCWTFNRLTAYETIDLAKSMGLRYLEMYPGQKVRAGSDAKTQPDLSPDERKKLRAKLIEAGIQVVNFGVVGLGKNETENRKVFEFAKAMGIETIVSEPLQDDLGGVERLADEYGINVALHNHPEPSRYWNPQTAYDAVKNRGKRLGLCADTGHWARSGVKPIEALKKYGDRILTLHLKDLSEFGVKKAHDVPWGTGVCDVEDVLAELKKQGFRGVFSIEYENRPPNQKALVRECVGNFHKMAGKAAGKVKVLDLFNGRNFTGWTFSSDAVKAAWTVREDRLHNAGKPNGYIRTGKDYLNFILRLRFRHVTEGNSGYLLRAQMPDRVWPRSVEVQGMYGNVGDIYNIDNFPMKTDPARTSGRRTVKRFDSSERALGEWNDLQIELRGGDLKAWVNGVVQTLASECAGMPGKICIQSEGAEMEYRNIRLIELK